MTQQLVVGVRPPPTARLRSLSLSLMLLFYVIMMQVWDPVLIISQIVSVQCLFYVSLGLLQAITLGGCVGRGCRVCAIKNLQRMCPCLVCMYGLLAMNSRC